MRRRGFTLIELLVVVAIIVVLIGILMPALGHARAKAKKTACLSNLRSTYLVTKMYASEYNEIAPLGAWARKQFNYIAYFPPLAPGTTARPAGYGFIHAGGYVTNGKIAYCPVAEENTVSYNTASNPWRRFPLPDPDPFGSSLTRVGYGMRPISNWVPRNSFGITPADPLWGTYQPILSWTATVYNEADVSTGRVRWPKINDLLNNAIFSDITPHYPGLMQRHKDGVNALYGSGNAVWVPKKVFIGSLVGPNGPSLSESDTNQAFVAAFDNQMLNESVTPNTGYWADLDSFR